MKPKTNIIFQLLLLLVIQLIIEVQGDGCFETKTEPPDLQFSDFDKNDILQNSTLELQMPKTMEFVIVRLSCSAPYPIELAWEFTGIRNQDHFDGKTRRLSETVRRTFADFRDVSTYTFYLELYLWYENVNQTEYFICRSIENPCLKRIVKSEPGETKIVMSMASTFGDTMKVLSTIQGIDGSEGDCTSWLYYEPFASPAPISLCKYQCVLESGQRKPVVWNNGLWCLSKVISCLSLSFGLNHGIQQPRCVKEFHFDANMTDHRDGFETMMPSCGDKLITNQMYFAVPKQDPLRKLYIAGGKRAPDEDLIYIEKWDQKAFYVNTTITIKCIASAYIVATPLQFGLQFENDDNLTIVDYSGHEAEDVEWDLKRGTYNKTLELDLGIEHLTLSRIFCFGPIQDSFDWINTSRAVTVKEITRLSFTSPNGDSSPTTYDFQLDEINAAIYCDAYGDPIPTSIKWFQLTQEIVDSPGVSIQGLESSPRENVLRSRIIFEVMSNKYAGSYTCEASEDILSDEKIPKEIQVYVTDYTGRLKIILASVFAALAFLGLIVLLVFFGFKLKRQQKVLRRLTEEEVRNFIEGDPLIKSDDLHANTNGLPFNKNYEILKENISVDDSKLLGAGEFGIVRKGTATIAGVPLTVAIKTCHQSLDVTSFLALLSEVKIMAYIGKHANVVSLIGAVTARIQERELYMAVEFCKRGDLLRRLRLGKQHFVNLLRMGELVDESKVVYQNNMQDGMGFSTATLLKWSRDISSGMHFLASRNVFHGDLAARNVLLTKYDVAKIGDFGLARQLAQSSEYVKTQKVPLPWKWMSIESLKFNRFSVHSDVWAYGVTLWEIFSLGENPYPGLNWNLNFVKDLEAGMRMKQPPFATSEIFGIMLNCWNPEPEDRMEFSTANELFTDILNQLESCE